MVGQLLLGLTILVGIHEWGHMAAAKYFGMRVEKYYIGFPPKVISRTWKGTEYALGAIPLGGFVKISGMIDESLDTKSMSAEPEDWEFRAKPAWQRLIVMLGGIIMNVITGVIVFIVLAFVNGESYMPKEELNARGIMAYELGEEIGFKTGDRILDINGQDYQRFEDLLAPEVLVGSDVYFTVQRGDEIIKVNMPNDFIEKVSTREGRQRVIFPRYDFIVASVDSEQAKEAGLQVGDRFASIEGKPISYYDELKNALEPFKGSRINAVIIRDDQKLEMVLPVNEKGQIGFTAVPYGLEEAFVTEKIGLGKSLVVGTGNAFSVVWLNIKGFGKMFSGDVSVTKSLSGPIRIATMFGSDWDWGRFWYLVGLLSMVLAFMNLLPIPALDGGHVVFLSWEIITGRKPGDKFMENAQKVGMVLLLALMAFVIFNDTFQLIFGG